jgi:hypothetical protein
MITPQDFKRVMAHLAGAVTVITTCDEGGQLARLSENCASKVPHSLASWLGPIVEIR